MPSSPRSRWRLALWLVIGTAVLASSFRLPAGSQGFYVASLALGAAWILGSVNGEGLRAIRPSGIPARRAIAIGLAGGVGLAVLFWAGALLVREIPFLNGAVMDVAVYVQRGTGPGIVAVALFAGIGEELFFRGAVISAALNGSIRPQHAKPEPSSTAPTQRALLSAAIVSVVLYTAVTAVTANLMLTFAAAILGTVTAWERVRTGGVLAPVLTHVTWSLGMLYLLPLAFA